MVTDPIADMLTRIRNANQVHHEKVAMPTSRMRTSIAGILEREGYIDGFAVRDQSEIERKKVEAGGQQVLELQMRYSDSRERVITGIKRISKPGLRVYAKSRELPKVMGGLGIAIISTSNGLMSDKEARQRKVGGEVLCYVW